MMGVIVKSCFDIDTNLINVCSNISVMNLIDDREMFGFLKMVINYSSNSLILII